MKDCHGYSILTGLCWKPSALFMGNQFCQIVEVELWLALNLFCTVDGPFPPHWYPQLQPFSGGERPLEGGGRKSYISHPTPLLLAIDSTAGWGGGVTSWSVSSLLIHHYRETFFSAAERDLFFCGSVGAHNLFMQLMDLFGAHSCNLLEGERPLSDGGMKSFLS